MSATASHLDALTLAQAARIMRERSDLRDTILFEAMRTIRDAGGQWMYAIQADGYGGDIKLGISKDPKARLKQLQTGSSQDLRIVGSWPSTVDGERMLHEQYAGSRIRGEWFMHSLPMWRLIKDFDRLARRL